jgi:dTDP-4-amino-4,6-dideoxygalactose transaminase
MKTKLFQPYVSPLARKMVQKVLLSTWIGEGPVVKQFEVEFSKKFNLKNVAALNSGTSALELAFELANIGVGDEVITPVFTCTATNIPLVRRG